MLRSKSKLPNMHHMTLRLQLPLRQGFEGRYRPSRSASSLGSQQGVKAYTYKVTMLKHKDNMYT